MNVFEPFFNSEIPGLDAGSCQLMPLAHTTVYQHRKKGTSPAIVILNKMKLKNNSEDNALFFFYARPARRLKEKEAVPVVFIVKPILKKGISKVYPFDTGAFNMYISNNRLNTTSTLPDYQLPNNINAIQQYINAIFGSNHNYFYGRRKADDDLPDWIKERRTTGNDMDMLLKMFAEFKKDGIDDRRKTVEIQVPYNYSLRGKLLAIIAPNYFFNEDIVYILKNKYEKLELVNYKYINKNSIYDQKDIYRSVAQYYYEHGYNIQPGDNYED
jgi:hypothetical protein